MKVSSCVTYNTVLVACSLAPAAAATVYVHRLSMISAIEWGLALVGWWQMICTTAAAAVPTCLILLPTCSRTTDLPVSFWKVNLRRKCAILLSDRSTRALVPISPTAPTPAVLLQQHVMCVCV